MAISIKDVISLKDYFDGVMSRADHHADGVNQIALSLMGGVIWKATDDITVRQGTDDSPANQLWMQVGNDRYCFSFNHRTGKIEVKKGSQKGDVIDSFDNNTPLSDVKAFFQGL